MNQQEPTRLPHYRLSPGTRLNGIYEIDSMIGAGGMGEIYKSHEIQTGTAVAIKMLLPEMSENEAALALFRREASALHYLMHDAIVRYFVFTVEPTLQRPYLAMEFVDGQSLADMLSGGPLSFEALRRLMRRVASGLNAAHERGITHRDVSPDNIIVPRSDVARAKIIDFGIARSTQLNDATIIGSGFAGKHNYVSPEQVGLFGGDVTGKSDVYSFGLVLFHALTGTKLDMGGTQFQLVEKRRRVPDLGAVDARIRPLLERMLQPDPAARPTMAEIENWNVGPARAMPGSPTGSIAAEEPSRAMRPRVRYGLLATLALCVIVASSVAYYEYIWLAPTEVDSPPPAELKGPSAEKTTAPEQRPPPDTRKEAETAPPKPPDDAPVRSDAVRKFVAQYDGGDCFFVIPVAIGASAAVLEGMGASTAPFEALDRAFKKSQGFEPSIGVRLVTSAQCPAVSFLSRLRGESSRTPRISLGSVKLRPGEVLAGNVENFANRVVELLLIGDDGQVQNVSYLLKPGTDALSFSSEIPRTDEASRPNSPQLLMAVTTPRVLDSLRQPRPTPADQFFLQVLSEAQRTNIAMNATARYITVQK
ncbi:Serine/threonine-protein kinase PrkC [Bradyrhizobium ivorense]|uniref:Serine/threonine-protein kinase PrkC n=1 Tax=Bradyrhizobium ivorense TaxID=2511166 RepID=A0A508TQ37_9BRAD|nr:serine/threonine-protein kinase [Bradyrhizobium ivorense]VIO76354.1 Serine/threonine-protein kinase PrkC [Bradyrhizobium ivorense]